MSEVPLYLQIAKARSNNNPRIIFFDQVRLAEWWGEGPLSSELGTHTTDRTRFWSWPSGESA